LIVLLGKVLVGALIGALAAVSSPPECVGCSEGGPLCNIDKTATYTVAQGNGAAIHGQVGCKTGFISTGANCAGCGCSSTANFTVWDNTGCTGQAQNVVCSWSMTVGCLSSDCGQHGCNPDTCTGKTSCITFLATTGSCTNVVILNNNDGNGQCACPGGDPL
jgi:hypothetical protein